MGIIELCQELGLSQEKCSVLHEWINTNCSKRRMDDQKPRKKSQWQLCIQERRAGKPFDPKAIKELAKEYREGKCP